MTEQLLNDHEFSLLRLMPSVLRARDFRLYTEGGRRLVDLWQNGGAAVLGHTPPSLLRELKNTASRGLYAPFPHFLEERYTKALSRVFPGRAFRLYAVPPPELHTLAAEGTAALWRPFLNPAAPLSVADNAPPVLIPVVPGIQGWTGTSVPGGLPLGLCVLAITPDFDGQLPPGDFLSPVLLATAARGLYDLIAAAPERVKPAYPRVNKALKDSHWKQQGLYLTLRQNPPAEEWAALFRAFLEAGFLLPPLASQPAVIPGILSPGEEAQLAALL
ncbi:MAG: hypothetical protein LBG95_06240 [Treponema sp.]|jgi:hypothetical protein|nr:hypothetical protein [Treponema sp.]